MEHGLPSIKSWKSLVKRRNNAQEGVSQAFFLCISPQYSWFMLLILMWECWNLQGKSSWKMKPVVVLMCTVLLIFWYKTTNIQYEQTEVLWKRQSYHV